MHEGVINTEFEGDLNRINKVLQKFIKEGIFKHGCSVEVVYFLLHWGVGFKFLYRRV